jgi:Peptidase A4 family
MSAQDGSNEKAWRVFPAPPKDFIPLAAAPEDFWRHGLPQRPDPRLRPDLAALWDKCARRYRGFEHLDPEIKPSASTASPRPATLSPLENCGFSLTTSSSEPFTALFVYWTVPDLVYSPAPLNENHFHTFVEIAFIADVHVEMSVNAAQHITSVITVNGASVMNLPVAPGDAMSAALCINTHPSGSTVFYVVANETKGQTVNLSADIGNLLPALSIDAGVTLDLIGNNPTLNKLPRFGVVYFDEISAYTTAGPRSLTAGDPVTLTDLNGTTLARPVRLNDYAFKTVYE